MKLKLVLDEIKELSNKIHQDRGLLKFYKRQALCKMLERNNVR